MVNKLLKSLFLLSLVILFAGSIKAQTTPCAFSASNPSVITKFIFNGATVYTMDPNETRGYIDSSSYVIHIFSDNTIPFTVQGFKWIKGGNQYAQYFRIFVDFSGNGQFTETGELLFNSGTVDYQFTGNLNFTTTPAGNYRMRLLTTYNNVDALGTGCGTTDFGQAIDFTLSVAAPAPSIASTIPTLGDVLLLDSLYTGTKRPKVNINKKTTHPSPVNVAYKIYGPAPINATIYEAFENNDLNDTLISVSSNGTPLAVTFAQAKGPAARGYNPFTPTVITNVTGELDLHTYKSLIPPGEYTVQADLSYPAPSTFFQQFTQAINIAFQDDIAVSAILLPQSEDQTIYPMVIPLRAQIKNLGTDPVSGFTATATVYYQDPNTLNLTQVFQDTQTFQANPPFIPLMATSATREVNFNSFTPTNPNAIGRYKIVMQVSFLDSTITDQLSGNNIFPRAGAPAYFTALKAVKDVKADSATFDVNNDNYVGPDLYVGRPVYPIGRYSNLGLQDVSNSNISYTIRNAQNIVVYQSSGAVILQDISIGKFVRFKYPDPFIPLAPGNYTATTSITALGDLITGNNQVSASFTVKQAMSGTYYIGTTMLGNDRNFTSIRHAVDTLYLKGISAPVDFILTDANYNVGDATVIGAPALDLTSKIVGVSNINTVTFHPSDVMSLIKGDIVINMFSNNQSGIGILIGQSVNPVNIFAPVSILPDSRKHEYANSTGNIIFDGGPNKAIKLILNTASAFRSAVYLSNSASYCSIKNLIITDQSPVFSDSLPKTTFNSQYNRFEFEADFRQGAPSYTSGVVMRSIAPIDPVNLNNPFFMDSVTATNNTISSNEIYGFGYGIVSIGTGPLYRQGTEKYLRYYNKNNEISYNTIYNVGRAGIFVGHEENTTIEHNRISNVNLNVTSNEPAGIIAGGEVTLARNGYNNIGLVINANEISAVNGSLNVYGIKVEQDMNAYPFNNPSFVNFPDVPENSTLENNIVRNLVTTNVNTNTWGIRLFTARDLTQTDTNRTINPFRDPYFTRNDRVANNTVIIQDDGRLTKGYLVGIGLQNVSNAYLHNNAIEMLDVSIDPSCYIAADVFYEGLLPNQPNTLDADRNAFWWVPGTDGETYRFIQIDGNSNLIEGFTRAERNDYKSLTQWQMWSKQDFNSQYGDFTSDLVILPGDLLRVRSNPAPLGSILNNRGDIINWVTTDIDNNQRGTAGQRYDIGASEFSGSLYASDVEVLSTPTPGAYMRGTGSFNDAEYIMTANPIDVVGRIRNNGSLEQSNLPVTVQIFRERPDVAGTFYTTPERTKVVNVDAVPGEVIPVDFLLGSGLPTDFNPKTYSDLRGGDTSLVPTAYYAVPALFKTMTANVTPKYKIVVTVPTDQNNINNSTEKVVRFYLKRSNLSMLLSAESSNITLNGTSTADQIAGRLNYDSLRAGMGRLNWIIDTTKDKNRLDKKDSSRYDYDIFERTGWETKNVNYSLYRTMFWSDGDDAPLSRYENIDINNFLNLPVNNLEKKNLIISSQDIVRQNLALYPTTIKQVFSADAVIRNAVTISNPITGNGSNNGNSVVGLSVGRGLTEQIASTQFTNDPIPLCALMNVSTQANGLARPAYYYVNHSASAIDSIMGVASTTTANNVLLFGVEWRHWKNMERLLESVVDFIENNGGVIPVELVSFDAEATNAKVKITWATQSEYLSDRFEIERAQFTNTGKSLFTRIADQPADGTRNTYKAYDPIYDYNVVPNNTYVYRLKMVDQSGEFTYSNEVEVQIGTDASDWLGIPQPNPAQDVATFQFSLKETSNIDLSLYDMTGNKVTTLLDGTQQAGRQTVRIDLTNLSSGSYMYVLRVGEQTFTNTLNVIK